VRWGHHGISCPRRPIAVYSMSAVDLFLSACIVVSAGAYQFACLWLTAGFMCSTGYMRMVDEQNEYIELLPVGSMHDHLKSECRAACFSDVVVRKEKAYVIDSVMHYASHNVY